MIEQKLLPVVVVNVAETDPNEESYPGAAACRVLELLQVFESVLVIDDDAEAASGHMFSDLDWNIMICILASNHVGVGTGACSDASIARRQPGFHFWSDNEWETMTAKTIVQA